MKVAEVPANEAARLDALRRLAIWGSPPEPAFDHVTELVARVCRVPVAFISFMDDRHQWFMSAQGIERLETPRDVSLCAHAISASAPLVVGDLRRDERFADNPLVTSNGLRFYAGFPFGGRYPLGTVAVVDRSPRDLDAMQTGLLQHLSDHVTLLLHQRLAEALDYECLSLDEHPVDRVMASLRADMTWLRGRLEGGAQRPSPGAVASTLHHMAEQLDQLNDARAMTGMALTQAAIQTIGLGSALEWICPASARRNAVACDALVWQEVDAVRADLGGVLCRALVHALDAAAQGAAITRIRVEVACRDDVVLLEVSREGRVGRVAGHESCAARLQALVAPAGGRASLRRLLMGGVAITAWLPLRRPAAWRS